MKPKNTICLWFDKDAHEAARFYAATFPDSEVTAVHEAPSDYPGGKKGDVLRRFPSRSRRQSGGDGSLLERDRRQWRQGEPVRLVQGPLGPLLADHPPRADRGACRWWR